MTEHSVWRSQKLDTSPVSRLRFTANEWKAILEAVTFTADSLLKEFEEHKPFWLGSEYFTAHENDSGYVR